jgi:hypothetical protein
MNRALAEETSLLAIRMNAELDSHLLKLQAELPPEEFERYRSAFGQVMGRLYTDIAGQIYAEHTDLKPVEMGGPYQLPSNWLGAKS